MRVIRALQGIVPTGGVVMLRTQRNTHESPPLLFSGESSLVFINPNRLRCKCFVNDPQGYVIFYSFVIIIDIHIHIIRDNIYNRSSYHI